MIQKLEPRHFGPDSGFGGATFSDVIDKVNEIIDAMNGEHDPADIYSEDGRLIAKKDESEDERIRKELVEKISNLACGCFISQEQKQKFIAYLEKRKESLRDFIDDFPYSDQQAQKPSTGIYWHAIKKGEKLPCRAYIWNPDYERRIDMNIEIFVNNYLQNYRHEILLNPYNGLVEFAKVFQEKLIEEAAEAPIEPTALVTLEYSNRCFQNGVEKGRNEMRKEMMNESVKWLVDDDYHEASEKGRFILGSVGIGYNGYYIPYSDLLKLPKEGEQ